MGLSERKVKQRIGLDPRNLTWSDDKNRFSYKHMTALGWSDKAGLGNDLAGNPNHIAVVRKTDNGGIGMARAKKDGDDFAAGAGQAGQGLEEVLRRLAASASASPSPAPSPAPAEPQEDRTLVRNRIASRQKHLQAKRMASSSPAALAEILGVPLSSLTPTPASPSPLASPSSTPQPESQPEASTSRGTESERTADETVTKSTLSVSDYFRQKMREKMLARQAASGSGSAVKLEDLPESSLERMTESVKKPIGGSAWEGEKVKFEENDDVKVEFNPTEDTVALAPPEDPKAAKKARKEAKKLAKQVKQEPDVEVKREPDVEVKQEPIHDNITEAAEVLSHFEHAGEPMSEKDKKRAEKEEKRKRKEEKKAKKVEVKTEDDGKKRKRDDDEGSEEDIKKVKKEEGVDGEVKKVKKEKSKDKKEKKDKKKSA
ncbi:hypothetical protein CI109_102092 [Kwoniella shandongensis]|uniref:PinX1-related protein 1 n=1 Tax=Kwoniella shandongensis TaxID=1734106 RepID=A0A5M6BSX5_9TREE|nr:uncharacterized protein CI109_006500 [Kwoniella shandongensis]KAA5525130.1 hypothetical protein CI109_006500 [Kwoniella shandongensis]